ncbi:MAG: heme-binding protein, partial [Methylococcaceae bacterium]|nr:heme-binding protein [Methylococcaceae bacterium]
MHKTRMMKGICGAILMASASGAWAGCSSVLFNDLTQAAQFVKTQEQTHTGGLKNNMWVTFVDETGMVCNIVNTAGPGQNSGATWGVSRVISVQKADTSALLSLDVSSPGGVQAWASGALFLATQPVIDTNTAKVADNQAEGLAGTLWGVQFSNLLNPGPAYAGSPAKYGTEFDPLRNKRVGGMIVFGGGLPLYNDSFQKIGAIGVSGDTSCTDHAFAWRVRERLAASNLGIANAEQISKKNSLGEDAEQLDISKKSYP